ncbi:MAG: hypothetical protein AAGL90_11990 [Pseudomonadota bacterium]
MSKKAVIGVLAIALSACATSPTTPPTGTDPAMTDPPVNGGPIDPESGEETPSSVARAYTEFAARLQRDPSTVPGVTSQPATSIRVTLDRTGRVVDIVRFEVALRRAVGDQTLRSRHVALIQASDRDPLLINLGTLFSTRIGEEWGPDGAVVIGSELVSEDTAYITLTAPEAFTNGTVAIFDRGEGAPRIPVSGDVIADLRSTAARVVAFPVTDDRGGQ